MKYLLTILTLVVTIYCIANQQTELILDINTELITINKSISLNNIIPLSYLACIILVINIGLSLGKQKVINENN